MARKKTKRYSIFSVNGKFIKTLTLTDSEIRQLRKSFPKAKFRLVK